MSETRDPVDLLFDVLGALAAVAAFLLVAVVLLWPAGRLDLVAPLARGLGLLALATFAASLVTGTVARRLRMNIHDRANAFIALGLVASGALSVGWAIHAACLLAPAAPGPWWHGALAILVGLSSTLVPPSVVGILYHGTLYRLGSLALGAVGYLVAVLYLRFGG